MASFKLPARAYVGTRSPLKSRWQAEVMLLILHYLSVDHGRE